MSFFIKLCIALALAIGNADRPKDFAALLDELTSPTKQHGCEESMLDSIESTMGAKARHWVEGQIPTFEAALAMLAASLPSHQGQLSQRAARYALHRIFVDGRGWFVNSLEESQLYGSAALPSLTDVLQNQVPRKVDEDFRRCFEDGVQPKELAVLAATLDHLVHQEVLERAVAVFKANKLPLFGSVKVEQMAKVLEQVMMSYILEEAGSSNAVEDSAAGGAGNATIWDRLYPNWAELQAFLGHVEGIVVPAKSRHVTFDDLTTIIHELQVHFGRWQDGECQEQMRELQGMELQQCPGHVSLRDFYAANLYHGKWQFSEGPAYLRTLGALDESQPSDPLVILPNYVQGPNNCVASSRYYSQCCLNPCSSHLANLEKAVAAPDATPELLQSAIQSVLPHPEAATSLLWDRLRRIAFNGKVSLHGLPFAEWLHRAYPRDCSALPVARASKPARPLEYVAKTGEHTDFSEEEMKSFVAETPRHGGQCAWKWQASVAPWDELEMETRSTGRLLLATSEESFQTWQPWLPITTAASGLVAVLLFAMYFSSPAVGGERHLELLASGPCL